MGVKERLLEYINYKQITNKTFEITANLSNGYVNNFDGNFRTKTLEKILTAYPDINRNWLLYGEGEMLVEAAEVVEAEDIKSDVLPVKCDKLKPANCRATMPFVSNDIVQSRDIDIRSLVMNTPEQLEQFTLSKIFKGVDYIQRVITEAMEPYYFPGDYLLVHFMSAKGDILSGATYLVDTKIYGAMLRKVYVRENGYTLKPHNPEFEEVFVSRDDVYSISIVVSMFRTNTNLTLASNLATLVKNRDEQIKRMVEAQQQMLDELCRQNDRLDKERERTERERERTDKLIDEILTNKN